jgi:hypothetical protein
MTSYEFFEKDKAPHGWTLLSDVKDILTITGGKTYFLHRFYGAAPSLIGAMEKTQKDLFLKHFRGVLDYIDGKANFNEDSQKLLSEMENLKDRVNFTNRELEKKNAEITRLNELTANYKREKEDMVQKHALALSNQSGLTKTQLNELEQSHIKEKDELKKQHKIEKENLTKGFEDQKKQTEQLQQTLTSQMENMNDDILKNVTNANKIQQEQADRRLAEVMNQNQENMNRMMEMMMKNMSNMGNMGSNGNMGRNSKPKRRSVFTNADEDNESESMD